MGIGRKIFFGLGLLLVLLVIQGGYNYFSVNSVSKNIAVIEDNNFPSAVILGRINTGIADFGGDQLRYVLAATPEEQTELEATLEEVESAIIRDQAVYEPLISHEDERQAYQEFESKWIEYQGVHEQFLPLAKAQGPGSSGLIGNSRRTI